jgi:thiol:disulfide interchange protein DsbD
MMATILATPCSGPFLGSTMAWAIPQPPLIAFSVFLVAGLGMAFPYAILTSNPALLKYVPRPGAWMETFKHLMGFLLLGTVVFLLVSVRQDLLIYTVALMIFVAMGCWWWGKKATFDKSTAQKLVIFATSVAIIALGAWFSFGPLQNTLDPKPRANSGEHLTWVDFDPVKLEQYHAEGRPVMLDFTADWCLTCKMNEKFVYESETVIELLRQKGAVAMKADMTGDSPKTDAIERLRDQLGAASIPFMAIFPGDTWEAPYTFKDLVTIDEVSEALRELRETELGSR